MKVIGVANTGSALAIVEEVKFERNGNNDMQKRMAVFRHMDQFNRSAGSRDG